MAPLVIIGSGLAGYSLARELRKLDKESPLIIFSADDGSAYSKPMLSNALTRGKTAQDLVMATAEEMAQQLNTEIRVFTKVSIIDSDAHTLTIDNEVLHYSKLVLALGADPFHPPLEGDVDAVVSVNDLADYDRFRQMLADKQSVAILGGGLIGCEFANDLVNAGFHVSVIDRNAQPLGRLLPELVGERLQMALTAIGVDWYGEDTVMRVTRVDEGFELLLQSGIKISADVVLSAIGLRARTRLAESAGLAVNRGIKVDAYLESSIKDIYALGDCAEVNGAVLPYILPLMHGARALARTLAGTPTAVEYPAMPVVLKTPAYPISVLPPAPDIEGEWQIEQLADALKALFIDAGGQLRGFALSGTAVKQASVLANSVVLN